MKNWKCSKMCHYILVVIIVKIIFQSSFLFYCVLYNHSFKTNSNSVTNLSKLFNYIAPTFNSLHKLDTLQEFVKFLKIILMVKKYVTSTKLWPMVNLQVWVLTLTPKVMLRVDRTKLLAVPNKHFEKIWKQINWNKRRKRKKKIPKQKNENHKNAKC